MRNCYVALLKIQLVLAEVLGKKITEKYISFKDAESIIDNVLYKNAKNLYLL